MLSHGAALGFQRPPGEREPDFRLWFELLDLLLPLLERDLLEPRDPLEDRCEPFDPSDLDFELLEFDLSFGLPLRPLRPRVRPLRVCEPAGASAGAALSFLCPGLQFS